MRVKRFHVPSKIKSPWDQYEIAWIVKLHLQAPASFEKDTKRAITHAPAVITCTQLATFYQGTIPMERCFRCIHSEFL